MSYSCCVFPLPDENILVCGWASESPVLPMESVRMPAPTRSRLVVGGRRGPADKFPCRGLPFHLLVCVQYSHQDACVVP